MNKHFTTLSLVFTLHACGGDEPARTANVVANMSSVISSIDEQSSAYSSIESDNIEFSSASIKTDDSNSSSSLSSPKSDESVVNISSSSSEEFYLISSSAQSGSSDDFFQAFHQPNPAHQVCQVIFLQVLLKACLRYELQPKTLHPLFPKKFILMRLFR